MHGGGFQLAGLPLVLVACLAILVGAVRGADSDAWHEVIRSAEDDTTFLFDSSVWTDGTPFGVNGSVNENAMFPEYSTIYVKYVKIFMDGSPDGSSCTGACTYTFELPDQYYGLYTLHELMQRDGGLTMEDVSGTAWTATTGNYFNFSSDEVTMTDTYYCREMGINYEVFKGRNMEYYPWGAHARIGVTLDDRYGCLFTGSVEGIGLQTEYSRYARSEVGSGRVAYASNHVFKAMNVSVYGSTSPISSGSTDVDDSTFVPLKYNDQSNYKVRSYNYETGVIPAGTDERFTWVVNIQLLRTETYWADFFKYGDSSSERSPAFWMRYDIAGRTNDQWYTGRVFHTRISTDYSYNEGNDPYGNIPIGQWLQLAYVVDQHNAMFYVNGVCASNLNMRGIRVTYEDDQLVWLGNGWQATMAVSDMRYYSEVRLSQDELQDLRLTWTSTRLGCGDSNRDPGEECDDGNHNDGDGCSSECTLESGYVCFGANSTTVRVDRCLSGNVVLTETFDSLSSAYDTPTASHPSASDVFYNADDTSTFTQLGYYDSNVGWDDWTFSSTYSGDTDWEDLVSTANCPSSWGNGKPLLGGYALFGTSATMEATYSDLAPHNMVWVNMSVFFGDSWDSEYFRFYADGVLIYTLRKHNSYNVFGSNVETDSVVNECGHSSYRDDWGSYIVSFYHNESSLTLKLGSNLGSSATDENWGVYEVDVRAGFTYTEIVPETFGAATWTTGTDYSNQLNTTGNAAQGLQWTQNTPVRALARLGASAASQLVLPLAGRVFTGAPYVDFWFNLYGHPRYYRGFTVTLIAHQGDRSEINLVRPYRCTGETDGSDTCGDVYWYRVCIQSSYEPSSYSWNDAQYCDERQDVITGTWLHENIDVRLKFSNKYDAATWASTPMQFSVQFGTRADYYGKDRLLEVRMDDINVYEVDAAEYTDACDDLTIVANSSMAAITVGDTTTTYTAAGWHTVRLNPSTHDNLGYEHFADTTAFVNWVSDLKYEDLIMVATVGDFYCPSNCSDALEDLGGVGNPFNDSFSDVSLAFIGSYGADKRSMPLKINLWSDGNAIVESLVGCHSKEIEIAENSFGWSELDRGNGYGNKSYEVSPFSHGYLGCYRYLSTSNWYYCTGSWTYMAPGTCGLCCARYGFSYFAIRYYAYCYCLDEYGQDDCDYGGTCGSALVDSGQCYYNCRGDYRQSCGATYYYDAFVVDGSRYLTPDGDGVTATCTDAASSAFCDNLYDGSTSSYFRNDAYTYPTFTVDLNGVYTVSHVRLWWYYTTRYQASEFTLEYLPRDASQGWQHYYTSNSSAYADGTYFSVSDYPYTVTAQKIRVNLTEYALANDAYFYIRELRVNVFERSYDKEKYSILTDFKDDYASMVTQYASDTRATSPYFKVDEVFYTDTTSALTRLQYGLLDYERMDSYRISIMAIDERYDSGDITLDVSDTNFVELRHDIGSLPFDISVRLAPQYGDNTGFFFQGMGSVAVDGSKVAENYGGVLYAFNEDTVRLWVPNDVTWGNAFNLQDGWGHDYLQGLENVTVRVKAGRTGTPDFDTGWFAMKSQTSNESDSSLSHRLVYHGLGDLASSLVRVFYRAVDGPNEGYVFEASGAALADDDGGAYGGLVYGYNNSHIALWAPNANDQSDDNCPSGEQLQVDASEGSSCQECDSEGGTYTWACTHHDGHIIYIPDSFGDGTYSQTSDDAEVRVLVYQSSDIFAPAFESDWQTMSANGISFLEGEHDIGVDPARFKAAVRIVSGPYSGWTFDHLAGAQGSDNRLREYGGAIAGVSDTEYRIWAPAQSSDSINHAYGNLVVGGGDGWGDGRLPITSLTGEVKMVIWSNDALQVRDTRTLFLNVTDVNEVPVIQSADFSLSENAAKGTVVATIDATDVDGDELSEFSIVSGNTDDAFEVDSDGNLMVLTASAIDYETNPNFTLVVDVSDGYLTEQAAIFVEILDSNDPPVIYPPYSREIIEGASANTEVGDPLNGTDTDVTQSVLYYLLDRGNKDDAFSINACGGQLRVANKDALDYEGVDGHNNFTLYVLVTDDGENAQNETYAINVSVTNRNDPPYWQTPEANLTVPENSLNGTALSPNLTAFCFDVDDGDLLRFTIVYQFSSGDDADDDENDDTDDTDQGTADPVTADDDYYGVGDDYLADDADDGDDGDDSVVASSAATFYVNRTTGRVYVGDDSSLNYEDFVDYAMYVRCSDTNPAGQFPPNLYEDGFVYIYVTDENDAPEFTESAPERYINENSEIGTLVSDDAITATDEDVNDVVVYSLSDDAQGTFGINPDSGEIWLNASVDYEMNQSFTVTVVATDQGNLTDRIVDPKSASIDVTIEVLDVNERPTILNTSTTVAENTLYDFVTWLNGSDPDVLDVQNLVFSITGVEEDGVSATNDLDSAFSVTNFDSEEYAKVSLPADTLNYEKIQSFTLWTKLSDSGGSGIGSPKSSSGYLSVAVEDQNDAPEIWTSRDLYVKENKGDGTVVATINATDEDLDTLVYSMSSSSNSFSERFTIDNITGVISVLLADDDTELDYETQNAYFGTVSVTDDSVLNPGVQTTTLDITIHVRDVNEAPSCDFSDLSFGVKEDATAGSVAGTVGSNACEDDDEDDTLSYSLATDATWYEVQYTNDDDDSFTVDAKSTVSGVFGVDNSTGRVFLIDADAVSSTLHSSIVDDLFELTVYVSDGNLTTTSWINVSVASNNDAPVLVTTSCSVEENVVGKSFICWLNATDADPIWYTLDSTTDAVTLNRTSGYLYVAEGESFDYETAKYHIYDVLLQDNLGSLQRHSLTSSGSVNVSIANVNDAPEIDADNEDLFSVPESYGIGASVANSTIAFSDQDVGDTLTCWLKGTTVFAASKTSATTCELVVNATLDYETNTRETGTFYVSDGTATDSLAIVVDIEDVNEPPTMSSAYALQLDENSVDGTIAVYASDNTSSFLAVSDQEGDLLGISIVGGDPNGVFGISRASTASYDFQIEVDNAYDSDNGEWYLDYESQYEYILEIRVSELATEDRYNTSANVSLSLNNVNDVTITAVTFAKGGANATADDTTEGLSVDGGDLIRITGTNFGLKSEQQAVQVVYGAFGWSSSEGYQYAATGCNVTAGDNTEILCWSAAGVGSLHRWAVTVLPDSIAHRKITSTAITTSYVRPSVKNVTLENDWVVKTTGGQDIELMGWNYGSEDSSAGDSTWQFAGYAELSLVSAPYWQLDDMLDDDYLPCQAAYSFFLAQAGESMRLVCDDCSSLCTEDEYPYFTVSVDTRNALDGSSSSDDNFADQPCVFDRDTGSWPAEDGNGFSIDHYEAGDTVVLPAAQLIVKDGSGSLSSCGADDSSESGSRWRVYMSSSPRVSLSSFTYDPVEEEVESGAALRATSCSTSTVSSGVECTTPDGVGHSYRARLWLAGLVSDFAATGTLSYTVPHILKVNSTSQFSLDTRGTTTSTPDYVTLTGMFFGSADVFEGYGAGEVQYGPGYEADCWITTSGSATTRFRGEWVELDTLVCETEPGVGANHTWNLSVGSQFSDASVNTTSYKPPSISYMDPTQWPFSDTAGGDTVTIVGDQFGPKSLGTNYRTIDANYGSTEQFDDDQLFSVQADSCEVVVAHTTMSCKVGVGTGKKHHWRLEVEDQTSNIYAAKSSYEAPLLIKFSVQNATSNDDASVSDTPEDTDDFSTEGAQAVVVHGENFGDADGGGSGYEAPIWATATYTSKDDDEYVWTFTNCSVTSSHVQITCYTSEGVGSDLSWDLSVDNQTNAVATTSYGPPVVTSVEGVDFNVSDGMSTTGGEYLWLYGENFGTDPSFLERVSYGPDGADYVLVDSDSGTSYCDLVSHSTLRCETLAGIGKNHRFSVTVAGQKTPLSDSETGPRINYTAPAIASIDPPRGVTKGGYDVTVSGTNFGPQGSFLFYYWDKEVDDYTYVEDGVLVFEMPAGQGVDHPLQVVHSTDDCTDDCVQESNQANFTFKAPYLDRIIASEAANLSGWTNITAYGRDMANAWQDGGSFGDDSTFSWTTSDGQTYSFTNQILVYDYTNDTESLATAPASRASSCEIISEQGGTYGNDKIICLVEALNGSVLVDVNGTRSNVISFLEQSPVVSELSVDTHWSTASYPTTGNFTLTVTGKYFGTDASQVDILLYLNEFNLDDEAFMDDVECADVAEVSYNPSTLESVYTCLVPAGHGKNVVVKVRKGGEGSDSVSDYTTGDNCFPCFSYDEPTLTHWSTTTSTSRRRGRRRRRTAEEDFPVYVPTSGVRNLTFYGDNLGVDGGAIVLAEYDTYLTVISRTHTSVSVTIPEGTGENLDIQFTIANQEAEQTNGEFFLSYNPPSIDGVLPLGVADTELSTQGDQYITLAGSNFGRAYESTLYDESTGTSVSTYGENTVDLIGITDSSTWRGFVSMFDGSYNLSTRNMRVVSWNHSEVIFLSDEGQGRSHWATLSAAGQNDSVGGISYEAPTISSIWPREALTSALDDDDEQVYLTLTGENFGARSTRTVRVGPYATNETVWSRSNHTQTVVALPSGQGANLTVTITVAEQTSNGLNFSYAPPLLEYIDPDEGPTAACYEWEDLQDWLDSLDSNPNADRACDEPFYLTLSGQSFGQYGMTVMIGDQICVTDSNGQVVDADSNWDCMDCDGAGNDDDGDDGGNDDNNADGTCYQSDSEIVIRGPQSYGVNLTVELYVEGRRDKDSKNLLYSFESPEIDSSTPGSVSLGLDYYDARGDSLVIEGENLGGTTSNVTILINGQECLDAQWNEPSTSVGDGTPYLTCNTQDDTVGPKNATITVALQTVDIYARDIADNSVFSTICMAEYSDLGVPTIYYGLSAYNELCVECPDGAVCVPETDYKDPIADNEFWRMYHDTSTSRAKERCPEERLEPYRSTCPDYVGCLPSDACLGNNDCDKGYEWVLERCEKKREDMDNTCSEDSDCNPDGGICSHTKAEECSFCDIVPGARFGNCTCQPAERCSLCTVYEYYKINGECEPCPNNVWILIGLFVTALVLFGVVGYYLNKKKFNLAFVSIGFDYFQVLAVFSQSDVAWPSIMVDFFLFIQFFSFDIDITAPECVMPDLGYETKWMATMALPIVAGFTFVLLHMFKFFHLFCVEGIRNSVSRKLAMKDHGNMLTAMYVVMLYYLYLPLTRKTLEIVNCNPVVPDDGYEYTDWTSISCEGGLCRCWEEGETQMELVPYAAGFFIVYSIGYPVFAAWIILKHKHKIKEDQLLRAMETGDTQETNPEAFEVRQKYHKLYYHFKPGKVYWILVIIARKFWIALAALMFRDNPSFQLSFILLVLFVSYVLQVKHRPFMSSVERDEEIARHKAKVEEEAEADPMGQQAPKLHTRIQQHLDTVVQRTEVEKARKRKRGDLSEEKANRMEAAREYFWDYNTVELTLLGAAIFVCVSGIMFESDDQEHRADLDFHLYVLTFLTMTVIISSLVYYFVVFASEVGSVLGFTDTKCWQGLQRRFMSFKYRKGEGAGMDFNDEDDDGFMMNRSSQVGMVNPMRDGATAEDEAKRQLEKDKELHGLQEENVALMRQVQKLKKEQKQISMQRIDTTGRKPVKKKKKAFDQAGSGAGPGAGSGAGAPAASTSPMHPQSASGDGGAETTHDAL